MHAARVIDRINMLDISGIGSADVGHERRNHPEQMRLLLAVTYSPLENRVDLFLLSE